MTVGGRNYFTKPESFWSASIRGIAATGICLAWVEIIFLGGRFPIKGSQIGVMLYITIRYRHKERLSPILFPNTGFSLF